MGKNFSTSVSRSTSGMPFGETPYTPDLEVADFGELATALAR